MSTTDHTPNATQPAVAGQVERQVRPQFRPLPIRLRECADEVMRFPHPSACDHLHVAHQVLREAADTIEMLRAVLLDCARQAEALKRPCGMDPEGGQALRNTQYQAISTTAHIAIGTIRGPEGPNAKVSGAPATK